MKPDTSNAYGSISRFFHWIMAAGSNSKIRVSMHERIASFFSGNLLPFVLPQVLSYKSDPIHSLIDVPLIGYVFPIIGLFISPVYPLISSATLSALPQRMHSAMTGLIVIFSALGGTLGSRIIGTQQRPLELLTVPFK